MCPANPPNPNDQVDPQKNLEIYLTVTTGSNLPLPDATLPPPESHPQPAQVPKTQQLGEDQIGNLEACERRHNWIDQHHPSKDLGVYIILSEITSKICEYVVYTGVYGYGLNGVGQNQRGPGVLIRGFELR
ncbi:hypothetical protein DSO57_1026758 [Entomophthora muscae]|uniref:Uncharacterized protein n=1 Tax=Entomophthora muscae TaxID=34485 RepID=A0ACC2RT25_9FUNG|nr:hypothetical protein DSO57_1026758 [Entomophthora muscae]